LYSKRAYSENIYILLAYFVFFPKQMKNNGIIVESEIVRRLSFKAEYDVSCDLLNSNASRAVLSSLLNSNASRAVLSSTLTHRRDQLQKFCAGSKYMM